MRETGNIYEAEVVKDLRNFYGELLTTQDQFPTIKSHLSALAEKMLLGIREGQAVVFNELRNYHPRHLGRSMELLKKTSFTETDCKLTIANEFGFKRWRRLVRLNYAYDLDFERAVDALLDGDMQTLKDLLTSRPMLLNQKSHFGHQATLLHYATSNGVELWRQRVPLNLPEIVVFLLEQGADKRAKMKVYGGEYTPNELLLSSAHPKEAGVLKAMRPLLEI